MPIDAKTIVSPVGLTIHYCGPSLDKGPLPAIFYFALTGSESLTLDPFNQPVLLASDPSIRVFSFTLPLHSLHEKHTEAMQRWAAALQEGEDYLGDFLQKSLRNLEYLTKEGYLIPGKILAAGLSRGGFIAANLAALADSIPYLLGYAPLTRLESLKEFLPLVNSPLVQRYNLENLTPRLTKKQVRFYIGNRDLRVGTNACFSFVRKLADEMYQSGNRSPSVEMVITPSIGHKGHGTTKETFQAGIEWGKEMLTNREG